MCEGTKTLRKGPEVAWTLVKPNQHGYGEPLSLRVLMELLLVLLGPATKEYAGVFGFNAGLLAKLSPPNPDSNQP